MKSKNFRFDVVALFVTVMFILAQSARADDVRDPQDFRNKVRFHSATAVESGGSLDIESGGTLKIGGTAVQDMLVNSFTAVAVPGPDGKTNVVTVTAKDMGGNTLAAYSLFECWIGDTAYSVPAAVAGEFTVTTGVEVQQITDKAHYLVMTGSNGIAVVTIEDDVGRTNALHIVSGGGKVTATTLLWDTP